MIAVLIAVGGLVYVGSVVASGGTSLGFLPHVISGMTSFVASFGTIYVLETTRSDIAQGYSSGPETYILNAAKGVMNGVLVGARFYIVPYAAEMVVSSLLGPYLVGVNVGGTILSAEQMIKAVAIAGHGLNATDLSFMINDGVAELTGYNAGKNLFGGKYEDAREVVRFGTNMMLTVGLSNPRLYQDLSTGNMQEIRWYTGVKESVGDKGGSGTGETVTYRRVQGGEGTQSSQQRVIIDSDGNVYINKPDKNLNISIDNGEHSQHFLNNRPDGDIYEFEVPKWFDDMVQENTIPQAGYKNNPLNQGGTAPKLTDPTTPGRSIEFPSPWIEWMEEYATDGRIISGGQ